MRRLLHALGNPEANLKILHIAGSKGKGSTALYAECAAQSLGQRTGVFTSPHLHAWTDRIRIAGQPISSDYFAALVARVRPIAEDWIRSDPASAPAFFEILSAAALLGFYEQAVDIVILETGLGGRIDPTNAVDPTVTCITSIEREHTDRLGDTLAAIAHEKAGIIKHGAPILCASLAAAAAAVIKVRAQTVTARLLRLRREIGFAPIRGHYRHGARLRYDGQNFDIKLPVRTLENASNAALAVASLFELSKPSRPDREHAVASLRTLSLPGRLEIFGDAPKVVVDAAHTMASLKLLVSFLIAQRSAGLITVIAITHGKDPTFLQPLLHRSRVVIITQADPERSFNASDLACAVHNLHPDLALRIEANPHTAISMALREAAANELVCVTGSMYLAGKARESLGAETGWM